MGPLLLPLQKTVYGGLESVLGIGEGVPLRLPGRRGPHPHHPVGTVGAARNPLGATSARQARRQGGVAIRQAIRPAGRAVRRRQRSRVRRRSGSRSGPSRSQRRDGGGSRGGQSTGPAPRPLRARRRSDLVQGRSCLGIAPQGCRLFDAVAGPSVREERLEPNSTPPRSAQPSATGSSRRSQGMTSPCTA